MPVETGLSHSPQAWSGRLRLPSMRVCLELLKPVTWFAPLWAFFCGVISSGQSLATHWPAVAMGLLLAGPMVCGTSQAVNDWFDRHVDAINEPGRPIPSGRMPGRWGLYIGVVWTGASVLLAAALGRWGLAAGVVALALAWAYSAPPLRLKRNGYLGNAAVGICYEGVPWFTGAAVMTGQLPTVPVLLLAALYSFGAHGIMTLNDFKSVEGDRATGIRSLPAMLGEARAAKLACMIMILPQFVVIFFLLFNQHRLAGVAVTALVVAQMFLMVEFLQKPKARAIWYNATGTTLYVAGMLVSALAVAPPT